MSVGAISALPPYALNAPGNNAQDRYYYANWVKDNVMPRLQQLGVDPKLVKQAAEPAHLLQPGKASLVRAFKDLYPNNTVQQVGQRMLDMMGEKGPQFPNLSI